MHSTFVLLQLRKGGTLSNPVKFSKIVFEAVFTILIRQSKYIQAIHKMDEMH